MGRLHRILAGSDGPGQRALPAGEFLHPAPLAAVAVLLVNDHLLKGSGLVPGAITGKLSDVCGLMFFPLLLTACADSAALVAARLGAGVDFSLRRWKLAVAIAATGVAFTSVKLAPAAAGWAVAALDWLGMSAAIVMDPTDLLALPVLIAAGWLGRREIARVPLGRLEVIERAHRRTAVSASVELADVAACGADPRAVAELAQGLAAYLGGGSAEPARAALSKLRGVGT